MKLWRSLYLAFGLICVGSFSLAAHAQRIEDNNASAAVEIFVYSKNHKRPVGPVTQEHVDVFVNGALKYTWLASTACDCVKKPSNGRPYRPQTPRGTFPIQRVWKDAYSRSFNNAPMHFALYFGPKIPSGYAIHATYGKNVALLGSPASAGCVRLSEEHAKTLFELVTQEYTPKDALITISDLQDKTEMYPLTP